MEVRRTSTTSSTAGKPGPVGVREVSQLLTILVDPWLRGVAQRVGQDARRLASCSAMLLPCASLAVTLLANGGQGPAPASRIDRLRAWTEAVTAHTPGRVDSPLELVSRFSRAELLSLRVDLSVLYLLVDDPSLTRARFVPSDDLKRSLADVSPVPLMLTFDREDLDRMRPIAQSVRAAGAAGVAKRGVVLHTDLVTLGLDRSDKNPAPRRSPRDRRRVFLDDGRVTTVSYSPIQWEIARFLATRVAGSAEAEEWVADWYVATTAFMQREQQYGSDQLRHALRVAASDPRALLLAGGEHEALASPSVQAFVRPAVRSSAVTLPVASAGRELAEAQRLLTQALERAPGLVEARVRLGRVLALRGRRAEAIRQLRQASLAAAEPVIAFYAFSFLGSELAANGDCAAARAAYLRAAERFPLAQSVNLALAELAWRIGQREEMNARLQTALDAVDEASDPWRTYHASLGRHAAMLLGQVRESASR